MKRIVLTTAMVGSATVANVAPAFASVQAPPLAGPGILGLVALGVVGAILAARWRK